MPGTARRLIAVTTACAFLLQSSGAWAATLPTIVLPQRVITVNDSVGAQVSSSGGVNACSGMNGVRSEEALTPGKSPALVATPIYNSGNLADTPWGYGWYSELDQKVVVDPKGPLTWVDGTGATRTYFVSPSTAPGTHYLTPINTYTTMETATPPPGTSGVTVETRSKDGTVMTFQARESQSVLRLILLKDRNGNTVTYARDGNGRLTSATDVHGRTMTLTYDASGRVATVTDPGNRVFSYAYDGSGNRTSAGGPVGVTSYAYNSQHQLTRITYPNGGVRNYAYDYKSRVTSTDDGDGVNRRTFSYGNDSTTVTDALGRVTTYSLTRAQGLIQASAVTDPTGGTTSFDYDANFNLTAETDPLGRDTHYTYDAQGNVLTIQDAANGQSHAVYESVFNMPTSLTDPLSHTTSLSYNSVGDLTQIQDPLSAVTQMTYNSIGHVATSEDPLNNVTSFSYEPSNGSLASVTDPLNQTTNMTTDPLNRVTQNTDPSGKQTQYAYDAAGDVTQVTDALGHATHYGYAPGREQKLLNTVTDANGHATTFGYDPQGRVTSVTNALGQTKTSQYDAKGNLTQTTNARGQVITYTYDSLDRLTRKTLPEGHIDYTYDAAGNLLTASHYNGSSIANTYDALNRLTQQIQTLPNGYSATIGYQYDAAGNRTMMTTPWGDFSYQYDANNRLTQLTNPQSRVFTFTYDADGRRTRLNYPNGVQTDYSYDTAGQVLSIIAKRSADQVVVSSVAYTYDPAGNRTSMTDWEGTHSYGYDDLHRLTNAQHPATTVLPVQNETFSYDAVGNRLADAQIGGYTYDAANRLVENSSFTYTYDADGNLTSKTDKATNQTTTYSFDSQNDLIQTLTTGVAWQYRFDANNRRIGKSSSTFAGQGSVYVYDGQNILAILNATNDPEFVFTDTPRIDESLMIHGVNSEYAIHADDSASIRAHTDMTGGLVETINYRAYGERVWGQGHPSTTSITGDPLCFTGRICDDESRLIYFRERQLYDPVAGRFFQSDPVGMKITAERLADSNNGFVELNLFSYADNSPTNKVDPTGLGSEFIPDQQLRKMGLDPAAVRQGEIPGLIGGAGELALVGGAASLALCPIAVTGAVVGQKRTSRIIGFMWKNGKTWFTDKNGFIFALDRAGHILHIGRWRW